MNQSQNQDAWEYPPLCAWEEFPRRTSAPAPLDFEGPEIEVEIEVEDEVPTVKEERKGADR